MIHEPRDGYERYFTEKIWEMIPETYRHEDGAAAEPGTLRALVRVIAEQAAHLRRSRDRLWDDQFIELADDWAVPYLADLVGTRLVEALDTRARRADVANTLYYRRRKGTLLVLEQLVADIAGWEGAAVEMLERLARTVHRLDCARAPGRVTQTPRGGTANLRPARVSDLVGGAFDELSYTLDPRRSRGRRGRHSPAAIALHLHLRRALPVRRVDPFVRAGGLTGTFDPSGRDVPLFAARARPDASEYRRALEWELPRPIPCRLLEDASFVVTEAVIQTLVADHGLPAVAAADLAALRDVPFAREERLKLRLSLLPSAATLLAPPVYAAIVLEAMTGDSPKRALYPASLSVEESSGVAVGREAMHAGDLTAWSAVSPGKRLVVDPARGRFQFLGAAPAGPVLVDAHVGVFGNVGAGTYERRRGLATADVVRSQGGALAGGTAVAPDAVTELGDSRSYGPVADVTGVERATLQARNRERPYLRLQADWTFSSTGPSALSELVLDGVWIGAASQAALVLQGRFERVVLRHVTLDPGGEDADGAAIAAVSLRVEGTVRELVLDRCIVGPVTTAGTGLIESLRIQDSIVDAVSAGSDALRQTAGSTRIERSTVFGAIHVLRLDATELLAASTVEVDDVQHGCFRFSRAAAPSRVPHPYRSVLGGDDRAWFSSRRFGAPGYAELSSIAPSTVRTGAENGSEMGAFSSEITPIRRESLEAKVEEHLPFGLVPLFVRDT